MRRPFVLVKVGRFRRSAARGMARAGFSAFAIHFALGLPLNKVQAIVAARQAPASLWNAAEAALFRESR
jgi:hypothetical protein